MAPPPKKPRPLHWYAFSVANVDETVCGKDKNRARATALLSVWNDSAMAGGRRCPACKGYVDKMNVPSRPEGR